MRTFKLTVTEDELRFLIRYNANSMSLSENQTVERSARVHDLTKRLNRAEKEENDTQKNESQSVEAPIVDGWN